MPKNFNGKLALSQREKADKLCEVFIQLHNMVPVRDSQKRTDILRFKRSLIKADNVPPTERMPYVSESPRSKTERAWDCIYSVCSHLVQTYHKMGENQEIEGDTVDDFNYWLNRLRYISSSGVSNFRCRGSMAEGFVLTHLDEHEDMMES